MHPPGQPVLPARQPEALASAAEGAGTLRRADDLPLRHADGRENQPREQRAGHQDEVDQGNRNGDSGRRDSHAEHGPGAPDPLAGGESLDDERRGGGRGTEPAEGGVDRLGTHAGNIWDPMRPAASADRQALTTALDALRRIIRVLRQSSARTERELGIGGAQLFVLHQLAVSPAGSVNELAERTYTHQSSVSVVVRRLVEQGLVARRPAADDARRRELRLTTAGRRLVERAPLPVQVRLIQGLGALGRDELPKLSRLLRSVVQGMGAAGEPASMLFVETAENGRSRRRG